MAIGEAIPSGALRIMYWGLVARFDSPLYLRWSVAAGDVQRLCDELGCDFRPATA